jgi:uncharacterized protein
MPFSMYQASVPAFLHTLGTLSGILDKAVAHADARKIDHNALLGARLFPDMYPLVRQVQLSSDFAKSGTARLAAIEPPKFADNETSFEELKERINKTVEFVKGVKPAQVDGAEGREITFPIGGEPRTFTGQSYLAHWVLPNFYFHVTTAYNLLRHNGVEVGKRDFLGKVW